MLTKNKITKLSMIVLGILLFCPIHAHALTVDQDPKISDTDHDGLTDYVEINIYKTNPNNPDTDGDGYNDGDEVKFNYDPNSTGTEILKKKIAVELQTQSLTYSLGPYNIDTFKISSGVWNKPTPKGTFQVLEKKPIVTYKGVNYDYPNTKWNLEFKLSKPGNYYIHGAYWHNNFGKPFSHGCVNVSYNNMEGLYNWAEVGTEIIIH